MRDLAIFDLDHTLTTRDTLSLWLMLLRGPARTVMAGLTSIAWRARWDWPGTADLKGRRKAAILDALLKDIPASAAEAATRALPEKVTWKEDILARYRAHLARGDCVVVATGALSLYARPLIDHIGGCDIFLGTELEMQGDHLTGRLLGENNARAAKAERVATLIAMAGPFGHKTGYGNAPDDLAFLELMDERVVVRR